MIGGGGDADSAHSAASSAPSFHAPPTEDDDVSTSAERLAEERSRDDVERMNFEFGQQLKQSAAIYSFICSHSASSSVYSAMVDCM